MGGEGSGCSVRRTGMLDSSSPTDFNLKEPSSAHRNRDASTLPSAESDNDLQNCYQGKGTSQESDVVDSDNHTISACGMGMGIGGRGGERGHFKRGAPGRCRNPKRRKNEQAVAHAHKKSNSIFLETEKARACTECGKEFSSWKALFGHMRCHPEREWRGIHPPQTVRQGRQREFLINNNDSSSWHPSQITFHKIQNLHGISREIIHRNKANLPGLVLTEAQSESDEKVASYKLACDDSDTESIEAAYINKNIIKNQSQQQMNPLDQVKEANYTGFTPNEIKEQHDMAHCLVMLASAGRPQMAVEDGFAFSDNRDDAATESTESEVAKFPRQISSLSNKQLRETTLSEVYVEGDTGHGGFECGTCKKVFRSHQALGGHRASHKKVKGCFARTNDADADVDADVITSEDNVIISIKGKATPEEVEENNFITIMAEDQTDLSRKKSKGSGGQGHQCSICFRIFSTGQALGGHKRCHWGATGAGDPTFSINHRQMLPLTIIPHLAPPVLSKITGGVIDLNLPAPMEDEEILQHHAHNKYSAIPHPFELSMDSSNNISLDRKRVGKLLSLASGTDNTIINKV
ncbi:hypothetical protein KI387_017132 [Taxus chinensis]|uniref:C2H2-type domain-containing protein n=1 Tax=Taxus chinensis TaxID=29808 RepID=A0AA38GIR2_TAXCH|nr:hypothetical protein KI387_017132 [Taxus chinensis]